MQVAFETPRLAMRPFGLGDARRISYLAGEYDVAKMCGRVPHPYSVDMAEQWLGRLRVEGEQLLDFPFAITLQRDGVIGSCGVTCTGEAGTWEVGYWLGLAYWGLGYASEALRGLMAWAQAELGAHVFTAGHFRDNPASGAVLRKAGFAHAGYGELFGMARGCTAAVERYVWPQAALADNLGRARKLAPATH
jgi:RimJ/RimL family protein N-acetyltransferase